MPRIPRNAYQEALKKAKRWLKRPEVIAVGLGARTRAGTRIENELCVVVTVRFKRSPKLLSARQERALPNRLKVSASGSTFQIPVDIEGAHRGRVAGSLHGIVGTPIVADSSGGGQRHGVVGAVVKRGNAQLVLSAGHVADTEGAQVIVHYPGGSLSGVASEVFLDGNLDHALITPNTSLGPNARTLPPGNRISGVRLSKTVTKGETVRFYNQDGDELSAAIVRTAASVPFDTPTERKTFDNMIGVESVCRKGDSGTLMYDSKFRAVATLVGEYSGIDYFLPCDDSFDALGVNLA